MHRLAQRVPRNKLIVAVANKLARIACAVLSSASTINISHWRVPLPGGTVEKTQRLESGGRFPLFHRPDDDA